MSQITSCSYEPQLEEFVTHIREKTTALDYDGALEEMARAERAMQSR